MTIPVLSQPPPPRRILWVFAWLVVGGEETEVRLLARNLPPQYQLTVLPCLRQPNMPRQTHDQLRALGVDVDETAYALSFDDTIDYIAYRLETEPFDLVMASQGVADIYPALEKCFNPPPLIEHGGLVSEVTMTPKHLTARYVGVCRAIQEAAAATLSNPAHALEIPSMIDLAEFDPGQRSVVRAEWGVSANEMVIGWVGRLDPKKRVEDFIGAAAQVAATHPLARFVVIGGPDAFFPDYADRLRQRAQLLGLEQRLLFLGDRPDVPRLMSGLDIFTWLSAGEGMPHVVAEAGAAGLPVIATPDTGVLQQICQGETGLFVPHQSPTVLAQALRYLIDTPTMRLSLGSALRTHVEREYSATRVVPRWMALWDEVMAEYQLYASALHTNGGDPSRYQRRDSPAARSQRDEWYSSCS